MDTELQQGIERAAAILRAAGATEVFVFGSAARGLVREGSDVDLAVTGLPPRPFFRAMADAGEALGRALDLLDLDEPNPFTRYLIREGQLRRVG